jgi:hypothetical protein
MSDSEKRNEYIRGLGKTHNEALKNLLATVTTQKKMGREVPLYRTGRELMGFIPENLLTHLRNPGDIFLFHEDIPIARDTNDPDWKEKLSFSVFEDVAKAAGTSDEHELFGTSMQKYNVGSDTIVRIENFSVNKKFFAPEVVSQIASEIVEKLLLYFKAMEVSHVVFDDTSDECLISSLVALGAVDIEVLDPVFQVTVQKNFLDRYPVDGVQVLNLDPSDHDLTLH